MRSVYAIAGTLFQQTGIEAPRLCVAVDQPVQDSVRQPRRLLEHRDRELDPVQDRDGLDQVRLHLREFRCLPACRAVEKTVEPGRAVEVRPGRRDAGHTVYLLPLALEREEEGMSFHQAQQHLRVPAVRLALEPDPFRERDNDVQPLAPERFPHGPGQQDIGVFVFTVLGQGLAVLQNPGEDPVVLLDSIVDPAGEHPVEYLVVPAAFDLRHPPDAPLRNRADEPFPVLVHGPVDERLPERRGDAFQDLGHVVREARVVEDDHGAGLEIVDIEQGLVRHRAGELVPLGTCRINVENVCDFPFPLSPDTETCKPVVLRTERDASDMIRHSATVSSPS